MWKKISKTFPEMDTSEPSYKILELSFSKIYYSEFYYDRSKPIIVHSAPNNTVNPTDSHWYNFDIGYWVNKVRVTKAPKRTSVVSYFKSIDGHIINKCDIDYWDYFKDDLPDFIKEE